MGQEKNVRIAYFVVNNIYENNKKAKKAIQHYLTSTNISINPYNHAIMGLGILTNHNY